MILLATTNTINILMYCLTMILVYITLSKVESIQVYIYFHLNLMYPFSLEHYFFSEHYFKWFKNANLINIYGISFLLFLFCQASSFLCSLFSTAYMVTLGATMFLFNHIPLVIFDWDRGGHLAKLS